VLTVPIIGTTSQNSHFQTRHRENLKSHLRTVIQHERRHRKHAETCTYIKKKQRVGRVQSCVCGAQSQRLVIIIYNPSGDSTRSGATTRRHHNATPELSCHLPAGYCPMRTSKRYSETAFQRHVGRTEKEATVDTENEGGH
jgi:hypothetical protein